MFHGFSRFSRALLACTLAALAGAAGAEDVSVVAKVGGIPWFNAMETGIGKAGRELGISSGMVGPTEADAAQQVRAVEDLIARTCWAASRSEEHTSELQSQSNLVCRLLLEKKKKT